MSIKNSKLPKGLRIFKKNQLSYGGYFKLSYDKINDCVIEDGVIVSCTYNETGTKLQWFTNNNIFYIFVNDVNLCYYTKDEGLVYI